MDNTDDSFQLTFFGESKKASPSKVPPADQFRHRCGKKLEALCNVVREFGKRGDGVMSRAELEEMCRGAGVTISSTLLQSCWDRIKRLPDDRAAVWDVLIFLSPPRASRAAEKLLGKVDHPGGNPGANLWFL